MSEADQSRYYSQWYYACIHVLISIPLFQTIEAISQYLKLSRETVSEVLDFLEKCGLAKQHNPGFFEIGPQHIHLGQDSANIQKHHTNWRLKTLQSLDRLNKRDLHYSVVFTLSENDAQKIKGRLIEMIEETMEKVRNSPEEVLYCHTIDFFQIES